MVDLMFLLSFMFFVPFCYKLYGYLVYIYIWLMNKCVTFNKEGLQFFSTASIAISNFSCSYFSYMFFCAFSRKSAVSGREIRFRNHGMKNIKTNSIFWSCRLSKHGTLVKYKPFQLKNSIGTSCFSSAIFSYCQVNLYVDFDKIFEPVISDRRNIHLQKIKKKHIKKLRS